MSRCIPVNRYFVSIPFTNCYPLLILIRYFLTIRYYPHTTTVSSQTNMEDYSVCKLLDKTNAKALIDSVDTILTDCDGNMLLWLSIGRRGLCIRNGGKTTVSVRYSLPNYVLTSLDSQPHSALRITTCGRGSLCSKKARYLAAP